MTVACIWFDKPSPTEKVAEVCLRFSPQICIRQSEAVFIEIGKCKRIYSEESFLARAQVVLRRLDLAARISIGKDITDSLVIAKYNQSNMDLLPLDALIEFADPFHREEALRKSVSNMILKFEELGVKNLKDFKRIPVSELIGRFGSAAMHCHQRLKLETLVQWPRWKPSEEIMERKEFPHFEFYGELEPILFVLKAQLDHIFQRLWSRSEKASRLEVVISCEKNSMVRSSERKFEFHFFAPQGSTKGTLKIIKERLAKDFEKSPITSPVEAIQTKVLATTKANPGQRNFLNHTEEKIEQMNSLHNQLIEICGPDHVYQAVLTEDRRPERSWKKIHEGPHEPVLENQKILELIPDRPTFLVQRPVKIEVTAGFVHINRKRHRILNWNPTVERITGGWVEIPSADIKNKYDRNYYHVQLESGQRILVFENPNREFYLHGYYG